MKQSKVLTVILAIVLALVLLTFSIAAPILSSVCVVSLLLSRVFLKEKLTKKQYLFITVIIVGILMLAVIEGE